jgi:hypothetical protein
VTVHPNKQAEGKPILVQDLGDEYVVVGGAGGSMNFTRFRKDKTKAGEYGPTSRRKPASREAAGDDGGAVAAGQ